MLRIIGSTFREAGIRTLGASSKALTPINVNNLAQLRCLSIFSSQIHAQSNTIGNAQNKTLLSPPLTCRILPVVLQQMQPTVRTVTKFSLKKGKRRSVKTVLKRFFRLHWGVWIRTKAGRHKRLWKKSSNQKRRLRQHVFTNSTQSYLLDKMVTNFWKRPKYYVDDPYTPYHQREEFWITRKAPKP
ncbi:39S ribosomal protein L35, mitochondrial [Cephus cinctus]|uniref:Large ribosomal subunit protein bL35m n=1 Tax=Cephus cinctus TaxID=211228 RepID=A0AAJ7BZ94_CEPCN|nr:39S ribosomal protein L35, mitochondrial [Cephus cinctus]